MNLDGLLQITNILAIPASAVFYFIRLETRLTKLETRLEDLFIQLEGRR